MKLSCNVASLIERYFTERLMRQRNVSPNTIASYRDTFRLLFTFAQARLRKPPSALTLDDLEAPFVGAFLTDLETERGAGVRTRNLRLTAIRSFFRFVSFEEPAHSALIQRVLAIPSKRHDKRQVHFLTRPEIEAILAVPDRTTWLGRRDHTLLLLAAQTGLRLSELIGLRGPRKIAISADLCESELWQQDSRVGTMGQFGFFDADRRLAAITAKGDPLEMIARVVPFESFRAEIEAAVLTPVSEKKSPAGRRPIDVMVMFRMLVLQSLYNLSDEQVEYQVRDRLSFTRFLGLGIEDGIPDGTTLWLFRETLAKAGLVEKLFERFGQHLEAKGYIARGGQMIDATIVPVPKQRNSRDENDEVKAGKTPEAWEKNPAKNRQKDKDARWTKKHGKSFYGYKNHVNADARHKLIRQYDVTDASVHDSRKFDGLLNQANTSSDVYADSAYRSAETEAKLSLRGLRSRIHHRANRNHPLSQAQENANRQKSRVRARIEHVFGAQQNSPGGRIVRTIGIARARAKIGLQNLAYNIRRLVTLDRMAAA